MRRVKQVGTTAPETQQSVETDSQEASEERLKAEKAATEAKILAEQNAALERAKAKASTPVRSSSNVAANPEDVGETVSATWGEELYSPRQFFTYRVGPFTDTTKVREGETRAQARRRLMRELEVTAEEERRTKMKIFLDTMEELFGELKKRGAA